MVDIFDEVSEDLRNERAVALAKRYGGLLLLAMLAVLAGVGWQQFHAWYQQQQNNKAATAYLALTKPLDDAGTGLTSDQALAGAKSLTDFAAGAPEGYRTLADLRAAALYANAGQATQAEGLWNNVADDGSADPLLRGLANLLWAQHALGNAPDGDVLARLQPLTADTNAYHGLARETQALVYLHEGKNDLAKALLAQIAADPGSPDGVRNRAEGLLAKLNG
ncbi:hypothetical protein GCM10010909_26740 [Acidocella aquatica]|uniref:Ancillary SecYEG translocon subunit/Cell division coordinator CpoB TPR domain-containing protein n=1 Tax=Acidocella aquatica TaxID=1922313 RepID=A0ABQ6A9M0_9PROT|nr:tetratricopeptide repeat protein [Acidocella aquatica]GLR67993.1 hypothetical protein GCM10010909_26740 [Acidocella aquatica]